MKKTLSNLDYFKLSQNNPESSLDHFYIFEEEHKDIEKYIKNTAEIKNILITIRTLQNKGESQVIIDKYFYELLNNINNFSNVSEFSCFVNACDNIAKEIKKNNEIDTLKEITQKYFKKRILNENVPKEWIQAILDNNSSRKKGQCGEIKLITILSKLGFVEANNWQDFIGEKFAVIRFSKKINLKNIRQSLNIKLETKKQNKTLDLIIKAEEKLFICEAKHLNTNGGGQDKQISELIEIIYLKEKSDNISYISFLDGKYSNILLSKGSGGDKIKEQRDQINEALRINSQNYWLNSFGFEKLFTDLKEDFRGYQSHK